MTISSYQVDNVIKAYTKQVRVKIKSITQESVKGNGYNDVVSLSQKKDAQEDAYEKISYNLMDIILKDKSR